MKREARDFRESLPKPVQRIQLDERHSRLRVILLVGAQALAAGALIFAVRTLLHVETGWQRIEPIEGAGLTCADEFVLTYHIGTVPGSAKTELKSLQAAFTQAASEAYWRYTPYGSQVGSRNLWWLNRHPNEAAQVDEKLYRAFAGSLASGRWLYLGPVYEQYESLFSSRSDAEAASVDPALNAEAAEFVRQVMAYIRDPEAITLELQEDRTVCLRVSDAYLAFAEEWEITNLIDFGWQRNAYIADDLAEDLTALGLTHGFFSSVDGFTRCMEADLQLQTPLQAVRRGSAAAAAEAVLTGAESAAVLRILPLMQSETARSYRYADGSLRYPYLSLEDGLPRSGADTLLAASADKRCGELLESILPAWMEDGDPAALAARLSGSGIASAAIAGDTLAMNGPALLTLTAVSPDIRLILPEESNP